MAKIEERQLLITARLKDGTETATHGHGLPYPLPILNPVWVGMGDIIAAKANGNVEITIHNLDTPVILNDSLYNKLYELGYVNDDIVKEAQEMEEAMYPEEELVEEEEDTAGEHNESEEETTGSGESTEETAGTAESEEATEKKGKKNKKSKSE
ncbi:hypothetical protein JDFnp1_47 [Fusobacterium phage JD-Fnp1]|nr:hypothetical protein JDFnp1_47 [Fusobacterium phage JD-Fnp1]